mmetsp:Transcript_26527/g.64653  ORF Transcript_26527/g.64653 Transcript_26527/m.64653 type:complete len:82 (+) Transcript_26527:92-337(+)
MLTCKVLQFRFMQHLATSIQTTMFLARKKTEKKKLVCSNSWIAYCRWIQSIAAMMRNDDCITFDRYLLSQQSGLIGLSFIF